jgi:ATP-dependent helicase/nuclease subunit A
VTEGLHDRLFRFRENLVVAASAGTGKTYTLVGVLVHLVIGASELGGAGLREPLDPARIVATTFSRKAAAEIRERFASALERLALGDPGATYSRELDAAFARNDASPGAREIARRARVALDRLGAAQIGTLHGFATHLVRSHALELGIAPGFELLSEDDAAAQTEEAVEAALARFVADEPEGARALVRASGGVEHLVADLARVLDRLAEDGASAASLAPPSDDAADIERTLDDLAQSVVPIQAHPRYGADAASLVEAWRNKDLERLEEALGRTLAIRRDDRQPTLADFVDVRDRLEGRTNPERARKIHRLYRDRESLAQTAAWARELAIVAQRELERTRRRSSSLAFGDVLRVARDLLLDRPDVAAEVGASLDALLVDEFQDTSRVQCDLVRLLWERAPETREPGALPPARRLRTSGLLVVGDRKQSIYGFRGADVAVFAEFCVSLAGWRARENLRITSNEIELPEAPVAKFVALRENWRSAPSVLQFANAFSARHLVGGGASLFEVTYAPDVEDLTVPLEKAAPTDAARPRVTWLRPSGAGSSRRIDEAHAIATRVTELVGRPLDDGVGVRAYRDFAVLALTNQMLDTMAFALARVQVPYVVAGRGFFSAREVRDVVAMLALLVRPHDRLALATVLRSPWVGASDRALLALTVPHRGLVTSAPSDLGALPRAHLLDASERAALTAAFDRIARLRRNVDRVPPATLLREAARAFGLEEALVQLPRGAQRASNVQKVFVLAERTPSARALLRKLERAIEREAQETDAATFSDEDDAVRLLTVHASKGLSFPVVFVPQVGADRAPRRSSGVFLAPGTAREPPRILVRHVDRHGAKIDPPSVRRAKDVAKARELAERRRLAYVAVTRAEEEMILVGSRKPTASEGYRASPAFTLSELAATAESASAARLVVEEWDASTRVPALTGTRSPAPQRPFVRLPLVPREDVQSVAVTPLVDFQHCARRFQLAHLLEVPEELPLALRSSSRPVVFDEPHAPLSPREEGTLLHAILERVPREAFGCAEPEAAVEEAIGKLDVVDPESRRRVVARAARFLRSRYAARIVVEGAELHREVPFVLALEGAGSGAPATVGLRGTVDLAVAWPDGSLDVIDYKRARGPSPEPYALQLDVYALAMRRVLGAERVRTGIVFLGGSGPAEPIFRRPSTNAELEASLVRLVAGLVRARWTGEFPRAEVSTCQRLRCGYVNLCHPKTLGTQLGLFGR